jgi:hypothetical protein
MKKSNFHLQKEILKTEIALQEKIVEQKLQTTVTPQNLVLKILPDIAKRFLSFEGKQLSSSFAGKVNEVLINVLTESQKVIGGVSHIINIIKELKKILKSKKTPKEGQIS